MLTLNLQRFGYGLLAFIGSAVYGASLSILFPRWEAESGALWVILSAGIGWIVLGVGTYLLCRQKLRLLDLADICLRTMFFGILVLLAASMVNLAISWVELIPAIIINLNVGMILLSNIVMGWAFVRQTGRYGLSTAQAIILWITLLDGSGLFLFWMFEGVLP